MVEVWERMSLKRSIVFAGMLFCLTVLFCQIISPALAGQGCGTNWMGDTSQDTDFWVSKNQNTGTSSPTISDEGKPIKASMILSLTPDKPSPQMAGAVITWSAKVSDSIKEGVLYDFYLTGPATSGILADKTGWTAKNSWTWNTTGVAAGEYQVEVRVKEKASTKEFDDRRSESYLVEETTKYGAAVSGDSQTASFSEGAANTSEQTPDQASSDYDSSTPNMKMPETKPIPLTSETTGNSVKIGSIDATKESATASDSASTSTQVDSQSSSSTAESTTKKPRLAPDERPAVTTKNTDGPNMDMPDTKPIPLASASTADAGRQSEATNTGDGQTSSESPSVMDVEGKWTIGLKESDCSMDLILIQSGETIMGSGTLNDHGNKIPLMASGSVAGNSMKLDVKTVVGKYVNQIDKSFNLDLVKVDRQISGSYEAYSGESFEGEGKVTASRFSS